MTPLDQNIANLPVPFICLAPEPEGKIISANLLAAQLFGYKSLDALLQAHLQNLADDPDIFTNILTEFANQNDIVVEEALFHKKDGSALWLSIRASAAKNRSGGIEHVDLVPTDITSPHATEQALRQSVDEYHSLFDGIPVGLYHVSPDGQILDANRALVHMLGYPDRETLMQVNVNDTYIHSEDRHRWRETLEARGILRDFEFELRRRDGSVLWVRDTARAVRNAKGTILYYEGTMEDITERRRAEQALRESEENYRTLAENTSDIVYAVDAKGMLTYLSPQVACYGFSPESLTSRKFFDAVLPEDRERLLADFKHTLATGEEFPSEFRVLDAQGNIHWLEDHGKVQRDQKGNIVGIVGVLRDICERKRLEETYHTLVDQSLQGLLIVQDERIVFANEAFTKITGYTKEELLAFDSGQIFSLIHPHDRDSIQYHYNRRINGHSAPSHYEHRFLRKDGQPRWVEVYALGVENQQRPAVQITYIDITERKHAEKLAEGYRQQLRKLATKLTLAEEKERRRLSVVLHDNLAQLIALMKIRLKIMQNRAGFLSCEDCLQEFEPLVNRADQFARSLMLQLSHPALYDIGFVPAAEWLAGDIGQLYGLSIKLKYNNREKCLDESVRVVLYQCLREALVNVAKHARVKEAYVDILRRRNAIRVTIEDHGIGFSPDQTNAVIDGFGFGLLSIRERLESLGGTVQIESSPGQGTRVILEAPTKTTKSKQRKGNRP